MSDKQLPMASGPGGLGAPTIMDPGLAARHGAAYVHLAVFAIDLDRLREGVEVDPAAVEWPFGWEVFLTQLYLLSLVDPAEHRALIEDTCLGILEQRQPRLGSQLAFAVYDLVQRDLWPAELASIFRTWRSRPRDLTAALDGLFAERAVRARELAGSCLALPVEPPLAPPTVAALERLAA